MISSVFLIVIIGLTNVQSTSTGTSDIYDPDNSKYVKDYPIGSFNIFDIVEIHETYRDERFVTINIDNNFIRVPVDNETYQEIQFVVYDSDLNVDVTLIDETLTYKSGSPSGSSDWCEWYSYSCTEGHAINTNATVVSRYERSITVVDEDGSDSKAYMMRQCFDYATLRDDVVKATIDQYGLDLNAPHCTLYNYNDPRGGIRKTGRVSGISFDACERYAQPKFQEIVNACYKKASETMVIIVLSIIGGIVVIGGFCYWYFSNRSRGYSSF